MALYDDEPEWTDEWLKTLGFIDGSLSVGGGFELNAYEYADWSLIVGDNTPWYGCKHELSIPRPKTTWDVLNLLACLGIATPANPPTTDASTDRA